MDTLKYQHFFLLVLILDWNLSFPFVFNCDGSYEINEPQHLYYDARLLRSIVKNYDLDNIFTLN